ncbi:MAG: hypothetical protein NT062_02160 [Proteobacteria bacterium]|nr:hypothetical protein [Pseudomonadota bacterium]
MKRARARTLAITSTIASLLAACGDDAASMQMMQDACTIVCTCGFNTLPEVEQCTATCVAGPRYSDACNACIADHDGKCTTLSDCDATCQ